MHTREEVLRALQDAGGNITQAARVLGIPRTTLNHQMGLHRIDRSDIGVPKFEVVEGNAQQEIDVLRAQLKESNRRLSDYAAGEVQAERIVRRIEKRIEDARPTFEVLPYERQPASERSPQEAVLLYSDLHASEVVGLEATRGINAYDWPLMVERMAEVQRATVSHTDHFGFNIEKLTVAMLGDMLSGDIHEELAITNDRPTADAIVDLAYEHVPWLLGFAEHYGRVRIAAVPGNHPRRTKKPSYKQYHNNADWLFYEMLRALLRSDDRFEFDVPKSAMNVVMVAGRWRALLMHGDGIRTTMPGVPWGGVSRRIVSLEAQSNAIKKPLDYIFMGHWHTRVALDGIQAQPFLNGSVKGPDEYSLAQFGSGHPAKQTLLTFQPERGWTGMYPLDLYDVQPASEGWGS